MSVPTKHIIVCHWGNRSPINELHNIGTSWETSDDSPASTAVQFWVWEVASFPLGEKKYTGEIIFRPILISVDTRGNIFEIQKFRYNFLQGNTYIGWWPTDTQFNNLSFNNFNGGSVQAKKYSDMSYAGSTPSGVTGDYYVTQLYNFDNRSTTTPSRSESSSLGMLRTDGSVVTVDDFRTYCDSKFSNNVFQVWSNRTTTNDGICNDGRTWR